MSASPHAAAANTTPNAVAPTARVFLYTGIRLSNMSPTLASLPPDSCGAFMKVRSRTETDVTAGKPSRKDGCVTPPSHTAGTAGDALPESRPPTGLRAMVVEDETALADLIGSYLERDGFEATITGDGVDAVTLARRIDPTFSSSIWACRAWTVSRCVVRCGPSPMPTS